MSKSLLVSLSVTTLFLGCSPTPVEDVKEAPAQASSGQPEDGSPETSASQEQTAAPKLSKTQILESRLKKIGTAFHDFHSDFGHFPPAASRDLEGNLLLSWRVHLLPFLGHEDLYDEFHLNEPWDSSHNIALVEKMPDEYASSDLGNGMTSFMVFLGDDAVFGGKRAEQWSRPLKPYAKEKEPESLPNEGELSIEEAELTARLQKVRKYGGPRVAEIQDGTSNTILVVQAGDDKQVPWTKPEDIAFKPENPITELGDVPESGFLAVYCDVKGKLIPQDIAPKKLAAAITRAGRDYDQP
jgi:hypothetical protein